MHTQEHHPSLPLRLILGSLLLVAGIAGGASALNAQTPKVFHACYVPLTGTVYRIKESNIKPACASTSHIEFQWTDGQGAIRSGDAAGGDLSGLFPDPTVAKLLGRALATTPPTAGQVLTFNGTEWVPTTPSGGGSASDHGLLSGLTDDDHPQYLLAGVRNATNGFAVTGTFGTGSIPVEGAGVRLMWYPGKAAFRAGQPVGTEWDDANVGTRSVAMGGFTTASGLASTAMGGGTTASGEGSTALGTNTIASGRFSTAMGRNASTNGYAGSFVYGDASDAPPTFPTHVAATAPNQFVVRASGGTTFYSSSIVGPVFLTNGVRLNPGAGAWASVSDVNRKHLFHDESGEDALAKIAAMPIRSWSYKSQDASIRHLGPTAQEFHAAFGLGESELTITTTDIDGVALLAIQALERRTSTQAREIDALRVKVKENDALLAELRARLERLERDPRER